MSAPDSPSKREQDRRDSDAIASQTPSTGSAVDRSKSKDQHQAEAERSAPPASKPGSFKNDPEDPTNPNEVRERHLKNLKN